MPVNSQEINRPFCEAARQKKQRLYFEPATPQEAEFIQAFFLDLGYKWYSAPEKRDGNVCVEAGIYLDTDGTLMNGRRTDYEPGHILCHVDQLNSKYLSSEHAVMMEEMRDMQKAFMTEIAGLKAEILALRNDISPPMEKPARLPGKLGGTKDAPGAS